jgi:LytR cell envelope-related transcriptional attenuator
VRDLSGAPSRVTQASLAVPASPAPSGAATGADNVGSRWIQQAPHVLALTPAAPTSVAGAARIGQALAAAEPGTYAPVIVLSSATAAPVAAQVPPSRAIAPSSEVRTAMTPVQTAGSQGLPLGAARLEASLTVLSRIEISNGHGRTGLAREMAKGLQTVMSGPARVTNHTHFKVPQTEVQYRSTEERSAAQVLARSLGVPEDRVVLNNRLRESAPVRLLLGRDAPDTREAITDTLARARLNLRG